MPSPETVVAGYKQRMTHASFPRLTAGAIALISGTALALAFIAQYGFDMCPCTLCYMQRVPYALTFGLGLLCLAPGVDTKMMRHAIMLCALIYAGNAMLAAFHAGVEYKWWPGLNTCGGARCKIDTSDLLSALSKPARGGCETPAFTLFGISMAGGNVIVCTLMTFVLGWAAAQKSRWSHA